MKKGFTLIELLAVIVILAIIALIATPIILGIIEDARKGSIEASANGYIDAVEYKIASNEIKNEELKDGIYDVTELDVDLDGEKPTSGTVTIQNGDILEATLKINNYKVYYDGNIAKIAYEDNILNGADPQLKDELVPVVIADDGKVTKANISKEWYNYTNKEWANAVILFDDKNYKVGEEIPETNIKEYYVWIPRYAYKLWNVNSNNLDNVEKPIEIVFGSKAKTTGEENGDMYLHPAFTNFNTQGIWVGKFEVSYNEETYTNQDLFLLNNPNYESATESSNIIIKPNVRSLTNKSVSEYHTLLYNSHRDLNSHMMTNMEWGATTYLTYSVYGRCDSETCIEVTNNNVNTGCLESLELFQGQLGYSSTITGCAADNIGEGPDSIRNFDKLNRYDSKKGYLASTTGNITGIYDMSGGTWEYLSGVLAQPDGSLIVGRNSFSESGFKGVYGCPTCDNNTSGISENTTGLDMPNDKYYNIYLNNNDLGTDNWFDYTPGLLGDATKEIANTKLDETSSARGNWFNDFARFPTTIYPWVLRGGSWWTSTGAGVFLIDRDNGGPYTYYSTRAVLAF